MTNPYSENILKEYKYWTLYLHPQQFPYLGRCYASCKRPEAVSIQDMTREERDELYDLVIPEWTQVVTKVYAKFHINIYVGVNTWFHLHYHLIPRFFMNLYYYGVLFEDKNRGKNYAPYEYMELERRIIRRIRSALKHALNTLPSQS